MNNKERFINALLGKETDRPSVFCANQTATYEQMELLDAFWPQAHYNAETMAALAGGAYKILGFDAVRVPFCQTIESEALGCSLKDGGKDGVPSIDQHPFKVSDKLPSLDEFVEKGRIGVVSDALRILKKDFGEEVAVLGGIVGPFSIATNLLGLMNIMMASVMEPEKLVPWLSLATEAGKLYGQELVKAGADAIVIEDMMSSMDMISPQIYHNLSGPAMKNLIDTFDGVPTILHICGKVNPLMDDMISTGASAFSVDTNVDVADIQQKIADSGRHVAIVGGIDAVKTLFYSKGSEEVKTEGKASLEKGYNLLAPSCSIPPATSLEKLKAMVDVAKE